MAKTLAEKAARMREYRRANPDVMRNIELKRHHGISLKDYQEILQAQGGVCAICKRPPGVVGTGGNSTGSLAVDHSHKLELVRGLLCTNCNLGIGSFYEEPELLRKAAEYLDKHEELVHKVRNKIFT